MDNSIVVSVCGALAVRGWTALRFNFRGTGHSAGSFDGGRGEMDDVGGAVNFLEAQVGVDLSRLMVVGYSFGAQVGLHYAVHDPRVGWLVGIALMQEHYDAPFLDADPRPKLLIAGERDLWAPAGELRAYVARLSPPKTLHIVSHTDHFFAGREAEVAAVICGWVDEHMSESAN